MWSLLLAASLAVPADSTPPPRDAWFGPDKVKHFFVSAFVQSAAYSAARGAKLSHSNAQAGAGVITAVVGVGREVHDRRVGRVFSARDLLWDAAGAVAAAALLNKTRR